jgi:hypothetical protein
MSRSGTVWRAVISTTLLWLSLGAGSALAYDPDAVLACSAYLSAKDRALQEARTAVAEIVLAMPLPERIETPHNGWLVATAFIGPKLVSDEYQPCIKAAEAAPPESGFDPYGFFTKIQLPSSLTPLWPTSTPFPTFSASSHSTMPRFFSTRRSAPSGSC